MNHKPFKNWILDDTPLTKEEKILLINHLQICPQCRQLDSAWKASEQNIKNAIRQAIQFAGSGIIEDIAENVSYMRLPVGMKRGEEE